MTQALAFGQPVAGLLLLLVPLLWLALRTADRARERRRRAAFGPRVARLAAADLAGQDRVRRLLFAAGGAGAALALLQPRWGRDDGLVAQRGIDLAVCLDVSQSMRARDLAPNRLEAARTAIAALAERARGDRLALVVFAGEARLLVPLTQDVDSFLALLQDADALSVRRGGTDLGAALDTALGALGRARGDHAAIVLVTDGEDHRQEGRAAAARCAARGVTVHCASFGSVLGSKIPVDTKQGEAFLRDASGAEVVTTPDPRSLRALAEATGGDQIDGGASTRSLVDLYQRRILPVARRALQATAVPEPRHRFQWFLLAAFLAWLGECAPRARRRGARTAAAGAPAGG